jgi:hypothetical protein
VAISAQADDLGDLEEFAHWANSMTCPSSRSAASDAPDFVLIDPGT